MSDWITLKELAQELGLDRSNMRKIVLAAGFNPSKIRTPGSRGQLTLALTLEDADAVRDLRESQGFASGVSVDNGEGWLYIIRLVPELEPSRIKIGFTSSIESRLQAYHTACPNAEVVKNWPCKRSWERAAMDCLTQTGCTLIANEVFHCDDIDALFARGDAFFGLMPA